MEAGFSCRTLKCLCWRLLQKLFFGLPSFPAPQNAGRLRSFVAIAPCPQTRGQYPTGRQRGRLSAGRGTARETTPVQGQPRHPPWKPPASAAHFQRTLQQPHCPASPRFPPALGGKSSEQASGPDLGLDIFGPRAVSQRFDASRCGTPRRPALRSLGHQRRPWEDDLKSIATRAQPLGFAFSRVNDSANAQGFHHRCLWAFRAQVLLRRRPTASSTCVGLGAVCRRRSPTWPPCPRAVTTLSPCHDHRDTVTRWCCRSGHGVCPPCPWDRWSCAIAAQPTSSASSPPWRGRPNTKNGLGVVWLFWLFYILNVLWAHNGQCYVQPVRWCLHTSFVSTPRITAGQCQSALYFGETKEWE